MQDPSCSSSTTSTTPLTGRPPTYWPRSRPSYRSARELSSPAGDDSAREDTAEAPIVLVGERLGGSWCLAAGVADERVDAVATVGTLASYRLIMDNKWNNLREYFWVPGALADYDLCDLPALIAPRPVALINTVDQMLHVMETDAVEEEYSWAAKYYQATGGGDGLRIVSDANDAVVVETIHDLP